MISDFTGTKELVDTKKRLFGLDLMRTCSILMVFFAHSMPLNPLTDYFPYFGWLGFGVEAFFVLSGYLIGRIILENLFKPQIDWYSIKIFWINRWLRTLPAYFFAFAVYYLFTTFPRRSFVYLFFGQNLITPIPDFFLHSWSLAVEEWFYLVFPIFLFGIGYLMKARRSKFKIFLIGTVVFIVFGLITKSMYYVFYKYNVFTFLLDRKLIFPSWKIFLFPYGDWDSMRKIVPFRIDAIAYGCMVAYTVERLSGISIRKSIYLLLTGFICLICCFLVISNTIAGGTSNFFTDVFLLPLFCLSFSLMIPFAIVCPRPKEFIVRIVTNVSQTSYSFYLMHFLVLDVVMGKYARTIPESATKWIYFISTYAIIYLISYLMFRFIEMPFLSYRKRLAFNSLKIH